MTTWVLIIFIASDLWIPIASFDTETQCYAALEQWDFTSYAVEQPPARGTCLPGVIEKEKPKRKRSAR